MQHSRGEYLGGTSPGAHSIHSSHMKHARYVPSAKTLGGQTSHVDRPWRNESGKKHPVTILFNDALTGSYLCSNLIKRNDKKLLQLPYLEMLMVNVGVHSKQSLQNCLKSDIKGMGIFSKLFEKNPSS
jgi:hypothetical protein